MKQINKNTYSAHQELSELLPWYVNKTLQRAELKAVEDHLAVCLTCKRELIQLQKLAQAVIQEGALDSAEQASFS
ncbi:MAG: zf-HC2 domain-containing protein, partial [Methyloglobulus sp.]|nr:zf-HC2 domain-containing protein [Methyloglobulus sp.]